jgi:hypothetical protein
VPSESEPEPEPEPEDSSAESTENSSADYSDTGSETDSGNHSYHSASHFDTDDESVNPDNNYRKVFLLSQMVKIGDQKENICYDNGATMSVLSER